MFQGHSQLLELFYYSGVDEFSQAHKKPCTLQITGPIRFKGSATNNPLHEVKGLYAL